MTMPWWWGGWWVFPLLCLGMMVFCFLVARRGGCCGVEHDRIRLYVWEKYVGSPSGKPVVVLAHGSATAGRESFDLQVPGKPSYSLMDFLAGEGFDVFAPDIRGFGRSTHPETRLTTKEAGGAPT